MVEILGNFFPCDAVLPNGTYVRMVRVLVTVDRVVVLQEQRVVHPDTGATLSAQPVLAYAGPHDPTTTQVPNRTAPKRRQRLTAVTPDGQLAAQVLFGCGCGSTLRSLSVEDSLALAP